MANTNTADHTVEYTALTPAVLTGHTNCIKALIEHGANVTTANEYGLTALEMAT